MAFELPKRINNQEGVVRKIGFELEFGNVPIDRTVAIIIELYGGAVERKNRFFQKVVNTSLGDFSIEMDARILTEKSYLKPLQLLNIDLSKIQMGESSLDAELEKMLEEVVGTLVPYEIGTPPVPITDLDKLERLRVSLFQHQAKGTFAFPTNIYGTHINPEAPDLEASTLLAYLRAFLLLYPWMRRAMDVDLARRISPYINPFPAAYADLVLHHAYSPDLEQLIEDYNEYNPDRNRPLDMYPIFAYLRKELVENFEDVGKVSARPTFHYRLPNSQIEEEDWSFEKEWNAWVKIDNLAADPEKIGKLSKEYLSLRKETFIGFGNKWANYTEKWLY